MQKIQANKEIVIGGIAAGATGFLLGKLWSKRRSTGKATAPEIKITYFDIEGVAEKVRLALVLGGVPFEDVRITFAEWTSMKAKTKYGQLPLMTINGGDDIAQSDAMLKYAGRLTGLYPEDVQEQLLADQILGLAADFDRSWMPALYVSHKHETYGYPKDWDASTKTATVKALREKWVTDELPTRMKYYADLLEKSQGDFFGGVQPSIVDCCIYPQLKKFTAGFIDHVSVSCLDSYSSVTAWMKKFSEFPAIKAWYEKQAAAKAKAKAAKAAPEATEKVTINKAPTDGSIKVDLTDGEAKWICQCGESDNFPFCDGSHRPYNKANGTKFVPLKVTKESHGDAVWVLAQVVDLEN